MSLTLRLTLYFATISVAILLAIGYSVGIAVDRHFAEEDRMVVKGKHEMIEHLLASVRSRDDLDAIPQRLDASLTGHETLMMSIVGADGRPLLASPGASFPSRLLAETGPGLPAADPPLVSWDEGEHSFRGLVVRTPTRIPPPSFEASYRSFPILHCMKEKVLYHVR